MDTLKAEKALTLAKETLLLHRHGLGEPDDHVQLARLVIDLLAPVVEGSEDRNRTLRYFGLDGIGI